MNVIFSGDGADNQGGLGEPKDPAGCPRGEVDDIFGDGDVRHGESFAVQLAAPNPAIGDRKRLMEEMRKMPKQFVLPVKQVLKKLDDLYVQSPSAIAQMESLEEDAEVILDVVRKHSMGKGRQYETAVTDIIGAPKNPSTIVTDEKNIGNKILPWLRSYLAEKKPGFKVTDLIAFGRPNFVRLHEVMVVDCNNNVGRTTATKRSVLVSWTVLCRALGEAVRDFIDELGDEAVLRIQSWYNDLATRVGQGVTRMKNLYERARSEKSQSQYIPEKLPLDQVIKKWIQSDKRAELLKELRDKAAAIENGGAPVDVSPRQYGSYSEVVQTEMSVYGPVRIGAVGRATVRMFLRSKPVWSASVHGYEKTRPVTLPPPDACQHQRHPKASDAAKCGLKETGEKCCDQAIPPTCFLMPNDKDKGGKSNSFIAISGQTHGLVSCFLTVRKHFFEQNKPEGGKSLQGTCPIFLSAKGREPRETSDFKLVILNKAVFGEKSRTHVTPQQLRKWNTTYLDNHPDAEVVAMRGEATGNTDKVYQQHYNLARQQGVLHALLASHNQHIDEDGPVQLSQEHDERQKQDKMAIDEANTVLFFKEDGTDLTSKSKPIHRHLRKQFQEELERVAPGLWKRAGGGEKGMALSEMKWVYEVVSVLGRGEAEHLRNVLFQQYRGHEDPLRRRWSSLCSHLEIIKKDRMRGGQSTHNCPLVATLRMFFSSACNANKQQQQQQSGEDLQDDRSSDDEDFVE